MFRNAVASLFLALVLPNAALAAQSPRTIDQFQHTRWTPREGAPWGVNEITQSPDGFIWLASPEGLIRFDGVKFDTFTPPGHDPATAPSVVSVLATRSGEIWAGLHGFGGVAVFRDGRMVDTAMPNPAFQVTDLVQDHDGAIWAATTRAGEPLRRYRNGRWEVISLDWNLPGDDMIREMIVGKDGALWIAIKDKLFVLPRGARRFLETDVKVLGGIGLAIDAGGRLWVADEQGVRRAPDILHGETSGTPQPSYPMEGIRRPKIHFAPDGSLWGATWSDWLFRIRNPDKDGEVSRYRSSGGLRSDDFGNVFVDREGVSWAGGLGGLASFVSTGLVKDETIPFSGDSYRLAPDGLGRVYVVTSSTAYLIRPGASPRAFLKSDFYGACSGQNGSVWIGEEGLFRRIVDGRVVQAIRTPTSLVGGCAEDRAGRLWWIDDDGVINVHERGQTRKLPSLLAGSEDQAWETFLDRDGDPLFLLENRAIARVKGLKADIWSNERLGVGAVINAVEDGPFGLFIAGTSAVARIRGDRVQRLAVKTHPWLGGARAITWSPDGQVQILSRAGLVRLKASDLDKAFDHPDRPIPHNARSQLDGLSPGYRRFGGLQAAYDGEGRYWFIAGPGMMRVQPGGLTRNPSPPPVIIRSLTTGGRVYPVTRDLTLAKGVTNLTIAYSALNLRAPTMARFRYRLEGVDPDWVDPGPRREAHYSNLPPGKHRFQVIAANEDGVWNNAGATLNFTIPKTFVQTYLFKALCALVLAILAWLVFRLRLRVVARQIRARMGERLAERERIARELHDTLLQGVQGLILRFQLVAEDLTDKQADRASLERVLDDADNFVGEARDRVRELRMSPTGGDLEGALDKLQQAGSAFGAAAITRETVGTPRNLDPTACDEIAQIVREALSNAAQHAGASSITIRSIYRPLALRVVVADNGGGIPPDILRDGREGHFGLKGMRERARRLEGRVQIESDANTGTRVTIKAPGGVVFETGLWRRGRTWPERRHG
jgi:signal transduction histidine kinase/ligand-binding sensor domain-containing protein